MINRDFHVFWLFNQIVCLLNLNNILFPLTQLAFQNFSQNTHQTFNNTTRGTQLTTNYDQTKPLNRSSPPPIIFRFGEHQSYSVNWSQPTETLIKNQD